MVAPDPLAFIRSLPVPTSTNHDLVHLLDVSKIKGNLSLEQKQLSVNVFWHFVGGNMDGISHGVDIGRRIRLVEMNATRKTDLTDGFESQTVIEIEVTRDMCNIFSILHGGCAAYLVDPCSSSAIVNHGIITGFDGTGMSQAMNLIWHGVAPLGCTLRIVNTIVSTCGRIKTARTEMYNKKSGQLVVSATHSTINVQPIIAGMTNPKGKL